MRKSIVVIGAGLMLAGCAGPRIDAIPEGYTGSRVSLADTVIYPGTGEKVQIFYADKVDGESIDNSLIATRKASAGQGSYLHAKEFRRDVPVRKLRVHLVGTHVVGMPIQEIASRMKGTFFEVKGDVEFVPVEGKTYVVMGELKKDGSMVWIQAQDTKEVVTVKVSERK